MGVTSPRRERARPRWLSLVAVALLASGCGGSPPASPSAAATHGGSIGGESSAPPGSAPAASTGAPPTDGPTASASSSLGLLPTLPPLPPADATLVPISPGYTLHKLPLDRVRRVALPRGVTFHEIDSDGPRFVMDEPFMYPRSSTQARALIYVDLEKGTCEILKTLDDGFLIAFPRIEGNFLVWTELRGSTMQQTGKFSYRLMLRELDTGKDSLLESGSATNYPALALDGGKLAIGITNDAKSHTTIRVIDLATRKVERSLVTGRAILSMAISRGIVAYSEGTLEPTQDFLYDLAMMLWRPGKQPVELARNVSFLAFRDGRLAWAQDKPDRLSGMAQHTRIWTSLADPFKPVPAAPPEEQGYESRQEWPNTGGGYVTWSSERLDVLDFVNGGDHLSLWDPAARVPYELEPTGFAIGSSVRNGWLVWVQEGVDRPSVVHGIPLAELGLPR